MRFEVEDYKAQERRLTAEAVTSGLSIIAAINKVLPVTDVAATVKLENAGQVERFLDDFLDYLEPQPDWVVRHLVNRTSTITFYLNVVVTQDWRESVYVAYLNVQFPHEPFVAVTNDAGADTTVHTDADGREITTHYLRARWARLLSKTADWMAPFQADWTERYALRMSTPEELEADGLR